MKFWRHLGWVFAAAGFAATMIAAGELPLEYAIKATYLYKFAPFVEWPETAFASPASPMTLCLVGADPFDGVLDEAIVNQRAGGRTIVVQRLKAARAASGCHILYVGGSDSRLMAATLDAVRGTPVLTITDAPAGSHTHGVINFVIEANHVRFDIDDAAAAQNQLVISSKLLNLAHAVTPRS